MFVMIRIETFWSWFSKSPQKDTSKLLCRRNDGKGEWNTIPVAYYPLNTAEYATAILASDWLYFSKHGIKLLYSGKRLSTLTNWVCNYTTAKAYQHWQTGFVIIRQWLCNWLYNGKSLSTLTNWVCDYTTAKVYEHREIKFVIIHLIIQRQKLINTDKLSLWLYNGDYAIDYTMAKAYQHWQAEFVIHHDNCKSLRAQRNQVCDFTLDYTTAKAYQH